MIKAGSTVKHTPTGEELYLLGVNVQQDKVCVAGYPPTIAKLNDCIELEEGNGITYAEMDYRDKELGCIWDK